MPERRRRDTLPPVTCEMKNGKPTRETVDKSVVRAQGAGYSATWRCVMATLLGVPDRRGRRAVYGALERRALALWPRLEASALRRCRHDPRRIAALVARRTSLSLEAIETLLAVPPVTEDDARIWFG